MVYMHRWVVGMVSVGVCTGLVETLNTEINNGKMYVWVSKKREN